MHFFFYWILRSREGLGVFYLGLKRNLIPVFPWTSLQLLLLPVSRFFFSIPGKSRLGYCRQIWLLILSNYSIMESEVFEMCWVWQYRRCCQGAETYSIPLAIGNLGNTTKTSLNKEGKCCVARKFGNGWRSQNHTGTTMEMFYTEFWFLESEQNSTIKSFSHF